MRSLSYKIGEQYPNYVAEFSFKNKSAPGQYDIGGFMGKGSLSMGYRRDFVIKTKHDKLIPGPGTYDTVLSSAPKYAMGKAAQRPGNERQRSPGPGYNPNLSLTMKKESQGYKMGTDRRRPAYDEK
jgi:hypothetical protein